VNASGRGDAVETEADGAKNAAFLYRAKNLAASEIL
jgi:hypothetical protein